MKVLYGISAVFFGAILAASIYLFVSAGAQGQIVSFYAMRPAAYLGFLGIAAFVIALNIRNPTPWSLLAILPTPILFSS